MTPAIFETTKHPKLKAFEVREEGGNLQVFTYGTDDVLIKAVSLSKKEVDVILMWHYNKTTIINRKKKKKAASTKKKK